tara:strand:+ start:2047 stop:2877 length:831 start_codon:yes stop_codon:yes gene_type:complete
MQIVDAQIHIWATGLPNNKAHIQETSFTAKQAIALMDEAGVHAAIIHPPSWDPKSHDLALAAVNDYPNRFAIMGTLPLNRAVSEKEIPSWKNNVVLGLRYTLLEEPHRSWIADGSLDWLWKIAEEEKIPISMLVTDSLIDLQNIAERHPELRLTIDHLGGRGGNTTLKDNDAMEHIPNLLKLAKYPNVAVKATGAPGYSGETYPFPIMQGYLKQIYDAFGPNRTFWGTDITKMPCSWKECITMFTEEARWLDENDRALVMGDAVCAWWGWDRSNTL